MSQELKPCPFCGPEARVYKYGMEVHCEECGVQSKTVAGWQKRTPDAAREKRMREVAEEMRDSWRRMILPVSMEGLKSVHAELVADWRAKLLEGLDAT